MGRLTLNFRLGIKMRENISRNSVVVIAFSFAANICDVGPWKRIPGYLFSAANTWKTPAVASWILCGIQLIKFFSAHSARNYATALDHICVVPIWNNCLLFWTQREIVLNNTQKFIKIRIAVVLLTFPENLFSFFGGRWVAHFVWCILPV